MKHIEKNKPWLDSNNNPLATEALKKVAGKWNHETWEDYLKTMELEPDRSTPITSEDFEREVDDLSLEKFYEEGWEDLASVSLYSKADVQEALKQLNPIQAEVIGHLYFNDVPLEEVAKLVETSSSNVLQVRDRAFAELRKILSQSPTESEGGM